MKKILFFLLSLSIAYAYTDPELENLWASMSDLSNPSYEDYRRVEAYLKNGKRPYLDNFVNMSRLAGIPQSALDHRVAQRRNLMMVGPNGEMPICEVHALNVTEKTKDRCILIFSSWNKTYPDKVFRILSELKERGYSGNVMIRIGAFPNLSEGGLKLCPFFFWKGQFIREALRMGFRKILHFDTSAHPLNDLQMVFDTLNAKGYYFIRSQPGDGTVQRLPIFDAIESLQFPLADIDKIPWLPGYVIGFNFDNEQAAQLFYTWEKHVTTFNDLDFLGTDEMIMSILTWNLHWPPMDIYQHGDPERPNDMICQSFHMDSRRD